MISNKLKNPVVYVIGAVHGNEVIGPKVIAKLEKLKIKKGKLVCLIGNPRAMKKRERCIEQDLNRSFPGKQNGNYEERLAYNLNREIKKADIVIDIHSTTASDFKSLVIVTKVNQAIRDLIKLLSPQRVALLTEKEAGKKSLIHQCQAGVSIEHGQKYHREALNEVLHLLKNLGMVDLRLKKKKNKTEFYKIKEAVEKETGFVLDKKIMNFKLIKKGDTIACQGAKKILAQKDFHPILFKEKNYKNIFGFVGENVERI